ncbi:hypothetical protein J6500_05065 [Bradyrhizobium sp. WSM 1704]|uniref:hypothetical protein n=1 Tax=Bradyrhizobium semiaridum TaxID=2821404 RepID=UPI001CE24D81|nr:hypothetical protein [Bradyrhizobium semiaridum]MCA6121277.1 hypothetical protein [Bradyrhizobium semiaridum]
MLADPHQSCILLVNLTRGVDAAASAVLVTHRDKCLSLLVGCRGLFNVRQIALGECEAGLLPDPVAASIEHLDADVFSLWADPRIAGYLATSDIGTVFLGGSYLEEDVLIAALQGAGYGYDVRILADLSIARSEIDRPLLLDRLAQHGIVATTMRQAALEWAVSLGDAAIIRKVRELLS